MRSRQTAQIGSLAGSRNNPSRIVAVGTCITGRTRGKDSHVQKLSIIIPVLGPLDQQEGSLVSVLQHRPADSEVLVVLNRPYDDPYDLDGEVRFLEAPRHANYIECLNLAIAESQAPIVHVLACGVEAVEGWTASPMRHFRDPQVAAVAPLVLSAEDFKEIVTAGVGMSCGGAVCQMGLGREVGSLGPWTSQILGPSVLAGFYRKAALEAAGGLDPALGHTADVDLAIRLRAAGYRLLLDPQAKMRAAEESGTRKAGFRAGLEAERLFLRHVPDGQWVKAMAAHLWMVTSEFVRGLPSPLGLTRALGRMLAWCGLGAQRQRHRELMPESNTAPAASAAAGRVIPRPHMSLAKSRVTRDAA